MVEPLTTWTRDRVARVSLNRFLGRVGEVEVGVVEFDGSNRLWTWSTPLDIEVWGHADSEQGAKLAFEAWLRAWLENFRPFFHPAGPSTVSGDDAGGSEI